MATRIATAIIAHDNNGLHTEPFLGRVSMLSFLYGPGEPGRYHAQSNTAESNPHMNAIAICKRHRRFTIAFTAATMTVYGLSFLGFIIVRDWLGFAGEWVAVSTIASAVLLSGTLAATCYFFIKTRYFITCPECSGKLKLDWWIRSSKLTCQNKSCKHSIQCDVGF